MTIRTLAKLLINGTRVRIYDGETLVEETTREKILDSDDNFYTLSVVRTLAYNGISYAEINLQGGMKEAEI